MNRFLLSSLFIAISACGLVGSDEPLVPFPGDGVGAFESATPVEVCLETARIIPAALATGATALCVPAGQTERACAANTDCTGLEKCICGRCIVEPCQGGATCTGDEVCRGKRCTRGCAIDEDCQKNERCISGGCARVCNTHGDCHYGERCDSLDDVCVVSLCGSGGSCGSGSTCTAVAEIGELGEPTFIGDEPRALVQLDREGTRAIYRAHVNTSNVWRIEPTQPILEISGESIVGAPSVLRRGANLELYAAVGNPSRIVRAHSSDDGATFVVDMDPILVASEPWENGSVGSPAIVDFAGATYLFYEGGPHAGIGLALLDATGAERMRTTPILSPTNVQNPVFWRNVTQVGAPFVLVDGGIVRILFTARGIEGFSATTEMANLPPDANDSIGLATTNDMMTFTLYPTGPLYARLVNLRVYQGESEATLRLAPNGAEMVFVSSDALGEAKTGLVRVLGRGGVN